MLCVDHMKYFIYARKSSEQEDRQVLSLDSQEDVLTELSKKNGLDVIDVFRESASAHVIGRKKFNEMLTRIENKEAGGIIIWDESRIARNSLDGGKVIYMMDLNQIVEIVKPGKTYHNTPDDKSWLNFNFTMTKKESDDKSVNVIRGLETKAKKGWLPSGAKPGYVNDKYAEKGNKTILNDPVRFPLIKQAWTMMLTGAYTVGQILDKLNNDWGYRTLIRKSIGGKPMCRSQIYRMFTDPYYYGEFEFPTGSGILYKGKHQPMITREEFDRVQILLGRPGRPRPHNRQFSFTGIMTCGECGSAITAEEKWQIICPVCKNKFASKNKTGCPKCKTDIKEMKKPKLLHYIYYHCTKPKKKKCKQRSITEDKLTKQIDEILSKIKISEKFKHWAIKYLNELNDQKTDAKNASIKSLQEAYNDVVKRIDNLVKLKISPQNTDGSLLNDEEFKSQKTSLIKERQDLESKMGISGERIDKWVELSEKTFDFAIYAKHWFDESDVMTKKEIFQSLGSNIKLDSGVLRLILEKPFEIIESMKKEIPEIEETIEPEKVSVKSAHYEVLFSKNPLMLPRVDSNHEPCR